MRDPEVEALVSRGELDAAAALAMERAQWQRGAELLAVTGRAAEAVVAAVKGDHWRLAVDIALQAHDPQLDATLARDGGADPARAAMLAVQARLARREDLAAMLLEETAPSEAAQAWYAQGEYLRAAGCFSRVNDLSMAARSLEQHLGQYAHDADAAVQLAKLRAQAGDTAGAVRALQRAVQTTVTTEVVSALIAGLDRLGYEHAARWWIERLRDNDPAQPIEPKEYRERLPRATGADERYAGRYRVIREVGSGASGRVLEAVDELTGETVALKVLSVGDDRGGAFGRFMREAEVARSLDDPCLVRLRALDAQGPTIVYDWMPGGTLADKIATMSPTELKTVASRVLSALHTLHRNGVVHRDIKPSNVLFDPAGQARVGDLGAAHLNELGATVTGGLVGSLPYMAPEQITGAALSAATDLYGFGCVLFQAVTGHLPFAGPDFVAQHLGSEPPVASVLRPGVPREFDVLFAKLLKKDPEERPTDALEVSAWVAALPWGALENLPTTLPTPRVSRTSVPPPAVGVVDGCEATAVAGRWRDPVIDREVVFVRVPRSERECVRAWAKGPVELQAVHDLVEDRDDDLVEIDAITVSATLGALSQEVSRRAVEALTAWGLGAEALMSVGVVTDGDTVVVSFEHALRARGLAVSVR